MRPLKILIGKPGLDGHDRGAKVIARALTESGIDVVYTGLHQSVSDIVAAAEFADVDAIGISILSGAHMTIMPALLEQIKVSQVADIPVFAGGIIPKEDVTALLELGVANIFTPGTPVGSVIDWVRDNVRIRETQTS